MLTSNKAFSEWGAITGEEVLATAILDRLLHHCDVLSINGSSYRLKDRFLTPPEPPMPWFDRRGNNTSGRTPNDT